jgi:hypothetical protein
MKPLSRSAAIEQAGRHFGPVIRSSQGWAFETWNNNSKEWIKSPAMNATACRTARANSIALKAFALMHPGEALPYPPLGKDAKEKLTIMVANRNKENAE